MPGSTPPPASQSRQVSGDPHAQTINVEDFTQENAQTIDLTVSEDGSPARIRKHVKVEGVENSLNREGQDDEEGEGVEEDDEGVDEEAGEVDIADSHSQLESEHERGDNDASEGDDEQAEHTQEENQHADMTQESHAQESEDDEGDNENPAHIDTVDADESKDQGDDEEDNVQNEQEEDGDDDDDDEPPADDVEVVDVQDNSTDEDNDEDDDQSDYGGEGQLQPITRISKDTINVTNHEENLNKEVTFNDSAENTAEEPTTTDEPNVTIDDAKHNPTEPSEAIEEPQNEIVTADPHGDVVYEMGKNDASEPHLGEVEKPTVVDAEATNDVIMEEKEGESKGKDESDMEHNKSADHNEEHTQGDADRKDAMMETKDDSEMEVEKDLGSEKVDVNTDKGHVHGDNAQANITSVDQAMAIADKSEAVNRNVSQGEQSVDPMREDIAVKQEAPNPMLMNLSRETMQKPEDKMEIIDQPKNSNKSAPSATAADEKAQGDHQMKEGGKVEADIGGTVQNLHDAVGTPNQTANQFLNNSSAVPLSSPDSTKTTNEQQKEPSESIPDKGVVRISSETPQVCASKDESKPVVKNNVNKSTPSPFVNLSPLVPNDKASVEGTQETMFNISKPQTTTEKPGQTQSTSTQAHTVGIASEHKLTPVQDQIKPEGSSKSIGDGTRQKEQNKNSKLSGGSATPINPNSFETSGQPSLMQTTKTKQLVAEEVQIDSGKTLSAVDQVQSVGALKASTTHQPMEVTSPNFSKANMARNDADGTEPGPDGVNSNNSAGLKPPMFGIQAPNRAAPVTFSTPPTFNRLGLNPKAKSFVPSNSSPFAKLTEAPLADVKESKMTPAPQMVSKVEYPAKSRPLAAKKTEEPSTSIPAVQREQRGSMDDGMATAKSEKPGASNAERNQTNSAATNTSKVVPKQDAGKKLKSEQKLRRTPSTNGGMNYWLESVVVIVKQGTSRPSRRPGMQTIELLTVPNGESKMEFSEFRSDPKNVWLSLSSVKDDVKIRKVINKENTMSVTVGGGNKKDTRKYFIHLTRNTFQVFYDACLKFVHDFVPEKERQQTVTFQEPKSGNQVRTSSGVEMGKGTPKPVKIGQKGHTITPKGTTLTPKAASGAPGSSVGVAKGAEKQKQLLMQKMALLKKKKAERSMESTPTQSVFSGTQSKSMETAKKSHQAKGSGLGGSEKPIARSLLPKSHGTLPAKKTRMDLSQTKKAISFEKPTDAAVVTASTHERQTLSQQNASSGVSKMARVQHSLSRQIPTSPKKRPAFRMEDAQGHLNKKARLNPPKKALRPDIDIVRTGATRSETPHKYQNQNQSALAPGSVSSVPVQAKTPISTGDERQKDGKAVEVKNGVEAGKENHGVMQPEIPNKVKSDLDDALKRIDELEEEAKHVDTLLNDLRDKGEEETKNKMASLKRCDPTSVQDFFDRLHTFRPSTWFGYGLNHPLSPLICARRGWYNSGKQRITSTEGAEIVANFADCTSIGDLNQEVERVKQLVSGEGHKLLSGWIGEVCPAAFGTLEGSNNAYSGAELKSHAETFASSRTIPMIEQGKSNWDGRWKFLESANKNIKLAAYNWKPIVIDEYEVELRCRWCGKRIPIIDGEIVGAEMAAQGEFDLKDSHFSFCPFYTSEAAVRQNAVSMGYVQDDDNEKSDVAMTDV